MTVRPFDVVVAGGGMAGASVAAAVADLGYSVLIAEPGLDGGKRLAGELIHPPGASDLAKLGLLSELRAAGGMPVDGFAVWAEVARPPGRTARASADSEPGALGAAGKPCVLPYADVSGLAGRGLALEHRAMTDQLLAAVAQRPGITVWVGARVTAVDQANPDSVDVTLSRDGREMQLHAQLLVAADGGSSHVRAMGGIGATRTRLSTMAGYRVDGTLPCPGFANVFVGPVPVLAYQLEPSSMRVMFDFRRDGLGAGRTQVMPSHVAGLPEPFRAAVSHAVAAQTPVVSASYSLIPDAVVKGRLALVGDAAGCCHPMTATGLSVCARDALRLREALRGRGGDIPAALRDYSRLRNGPQRTRLTLASAVYEAFSGHTPEMRLLRRGMLRYWERSQRARSVSMALLSTHEGRMGVMALEYARVAAYGILELVRPTETVHERPWRRGRAVYGLSRSTMRYAAAALSALRTPR